LSHGVISSPLAQKDSTKLTIFWLIRIAQEMLFSTIPSLAKIGQTVKKLKQVIAKTIEHLTPFLFLK